MSQINDGFIEIKKVVSKGGVNVAANSECIPAKSVYSFRPWHKGKNDKYIQGEMTQLLIFRDPDESVKISSKVVGGSTVESVESKKLKSILIEEAYNSFATRMGDKRFVRRVD